MKPKSIIRSLTRAVRRKLHQRPRIVMTLLCRNEEDIIGYNIAYHLAQGVDFVIATDNASRDRTPRLLERFARLGKLHLIHEPSLTHDQSVWVTRMAQMAATGFDADWVINNDADEFWGAPDRSLREALSAVPAETVCLSVPRLDMLPPRSTGEKFYESMLVHARVATAIHSGQSIPKACHRGYPDIRVADGNHHVKRRGARLPESTDHPLRILHYPLRSPSQLERKIRQGVEALESNTRVTARTGGHWRRLHRDYLLTGRLEEYYLENAPTVEQVTAGIADGTLVRDTAIRDALRQLDPALVDPDRH